MMMVRCDILVRLAKWRASEGFIDAAIFLICEHMLMSLLMVVIVTAMTAMMTMMMTTMIIVMKSVNLMRILVVVKNEQVLEKLNKVSKRKKWKVPFWSNLLTDQVTGPDV